MIRYLVGGRSAIEPIARSWWSLPIGLVLVLTAGIARNYDGAYLPAEWPVLLHGLVVSFANAVAHLMLVYGAARLRSRATPPYVRGCLEFVGLFWITAPMAWACAMPYERFLAPREAVEANLWTLAAVAPWRLAMMTRALLVLHNCRAAPVFFLVMTFADGALLAALALPPLPVINLMGGIQHVEHDDVLASAGFATRIWAVLSALAWLLGALVGLYWLRPAWMLPMPQEGPLPRQLLGFSAGALLPCGLLLPAAQPQQRLRWRAEAPLKSGAIVEGLQEMSGHQRAEIPRIWDPPRRLRYGEDVPSMAAIRTALAEGRYAPKVEEEFLEKSWREISAHTVWGRTDRGDPESLIEVLERWSETLGTKPESTWKVDALTFHLEYDSVLSAVQRARLRKILQAEAIAKDAAAAGASPAAADPRPGGVKGG